MKPKPVFDFPKVCEALRFGHGLNYEQVGRWLIRRGHVKDMEEYERLCRESDGA